LNCQESQRWREKYLRKKGLHVIEVVALKNLMW
jgi:hypothetical protein